MNTLGMLISDTSSLREALLSEQSIDEANKYFATLFHTTTDESVRKDCRNNIVVVNLPAIINIANRILKKSWVNNKRTLSNKTTEECTYLPDLIQEGIIGCLRGLDKYCPTRKNKVITYLYKCSSTAMAKYIHKEGKKWCRPLDNDFVDTQNKKYRAYRPALNYDQLDKLNKAITALPEKQRQAVQLTLQNLDGVAIGKHLNMSRQGVNYHLQRAYSGLQNSLDRDNFLS
jgi:RNA polymerase sigma factor (sigma-70 family)